MAAPTLPTTRFPAITTVHAERLARLRLRMRADGLAAVAATSPENVYYFCGLDHLGYFAFTMLVVPLDGTPTLVTREMERPTVLAQLPGCAHVTFSDGSRPDPAASGVLASVTAPGDTIALDDESLFLAPTVAFGLRSLLPERSWCCGSGMLAELRAAKSDGEIASTRRAAVISDAAMRAGLAAAVPGAPERDVAAATYAAMISAGGGQPGFPPLIRPASMLDREHVTWGDRTVQPGQGLFLELSGCADRYHAPLARTVYIGSPPRAAREAARRAEDGLAAAREQLRPGTTTGAVYAAWERAAAGRSGTRAPLRHHCGYLVGIGFPPSWVGGGEVPGIRRGGTTEIRPGMTFHLMSWVTEPAGHVLSDTVLVTATGAETLTTVDHLLTIH